MIFGPISAAANIKFKLRPAFCMSNTWQKQGKSIKKKKKATAQPANSTQSMMGNETGSREERALTQQNDAAVANSQQRDNATVAKASTGER